MATTLLEGANILNQSMREIGYNFQIDVTDNDTITADITKIGAFPPEQLNPILTQMNLIIQTRNFANMFTSDDNQFREFIVDMNETGFGIEDIFHELIEGVKPQWDKNATGAQKAERMFSYDNNKIHKTFHVEDDDNQVKTTIDMRNAHKLFTPYGVTSFIDVKLANLSYSMEVWLMDKIIETAKKMITDQKCIFIDEMDINSVQGVMNACETIRATTSGFRTPNSLYNYGVYDETTNSFRSVRTFTKRPEDIYIITTPDNFERLKVQGYANAYNLGEFELKNRVIYVPSGTDLGKGPTGEDVLFLACDRRTLVIGIKFWRGSSVFLPTAFETNNFLSAEILKSYNTFFNCVAFTGGALEPIKKNDEDGQTVLSLITGRSDFTSIIDVKFNDTELLKTDFISQSFNTGTEAVYIYTYNKPLGDGIFSVKAVTEFTVPFNVYINGVPFSLKPSRSTYMDYKVSDGSIIGTSIIATT